MDIWALHRAGVWRMPAAWEVWIKLVTVGNSFAEKYDTSSGHNLLQNWSRSFGDTSTFGKNRSFGLSQKGAHEVSNAVTDIASLIGAFSNSIAAGSISF